MLDYALTVAPERSVVGSNQALAYIKHTSQNLKICSSLTRFRFCNHVYPRAGTLHVRIPLPNGGFPSFAADIVHAYVSVLLGLHVMQFSGLILDFGTNNERQIHEQCIMPMTFKNGNSFTTWPTYSVCFRHSELHNSIFTFITHLLVSR